MKVLVNPATDASDRIPPNIDVGVSSRKEGYHRYRLTRGSPGVFLDCDVVAGKPNDGGNSVDLLHGLRTCEFCGSDLKGMCEFHGLNQTTGARPKARNSQRSAGSSNCEWGQEDDLPNFYSRRIILGNCVCSCV